MLLPDAKADAKLSLYVTQDTVFQHRAALKDLPKATELFVVVGDESYRILKRVDGATERLFAQVRPSLFIELADRARFDEALWQLMRPLDRARVRVLALEPGGPSTITSTPRIDAASKRAAVDIIDPASLPAAMGSIRGQTVLVTGRVDGQLLYVKPSSGPEKSLLVRDLLRAAEDADVNLVVLQSASTPRQPGGRNWFWQKVEVKGLDEALQRARMADFLNALAGTRPPLRRDGHAVGHAAHRPRHPAGARPAGRPGHQAGRRHVLRPRRRRCRPRADRRRAGQPAQRRAPAGAGPAHLPGIPSDLQFVYIVLMVDRPARAAGLAPPGGGASGRRSRPPSMPAAAATGPARARARRDVPAACSCRSTAQPALVVHIVQSIWHLVTTPVRWWRWLTGRAPRRGLGACRALCRIQRAHAQRCHGSLDTETSPG